MMLPIVSLGNVTMLLLFFNEGSCPGQVNSEHMKYLQAKSGWPSVAFISSYPLFMT